MYPERESDMPAINRRAAASRQGVRVFLPVLLTLTLLVGACGRTTPPDATASPNGTQSSATATPADVSPTATPASASAAQTDPSVTASAQPTESFRPWAADDFEVPSGSAVSRDAWIAFLHAALRDGFSAYSGAHAFIEAFGFQSEPSAGSGEWRVNGFVSIAWFTPGSGMMQFMSNRELSGVSMLVLEQDGRLTLADLASDFTDQAEPEAVEASLQAAYREWLDTWESACPAGVAALPTVDAPIVRTPVGSLHDDFLPPAQGTITADLDGDGTEETLEVVYREDDTKWEMRCGTYTVTEWYEAPEGVYLVDLDKGDGRLEIAVTDRGPSSDETTTLYAWQKTGFVRVGNVSGILFDGDGNGRVSTYARSWQGPLLTWFFRIEYALDAMGRLAMVPTKWYASALPVTLKRDLATYAAPETEDAGVVLPAGTAVTIDLSDITEWFRLTAKDGTQGWIRFVDGENLQLPGGGTINQTDVLDGIVAAD